MKKLFAIVLTVALVLGLATTAFAAWGPSTTANDPAKFPTVEVIKYIKHTAAAGSYYYTVEPGAQAVNDADVYFAIKMVVPDLSNTVKGLAKVKVTSEGLGFNAVSFPELSLASYGVDAEGTYYCTAAGWNKASALGPNGYIVQSRVRDTDTAKVTVTVTAKDKFKEFPDTLTKDIWSVLWASKSQVNVFKTNAGPYVAFERSSSNGLVTKVMYYKTATDKAEVVLNSDATNGFTLNAKDGATMLSADETYVKDALAFCGFTMADVKAKVIYMTDANCIANFGTNLKATSSATWGAAKDPIILDAVTVIPKTGDVVTIGAAVMTLVAAAGALSFRKH